MKEQQFRFRGKTYKIFIRPDAPHGPYYIHFQVHGRRIKRCLHSKSASVAIQTAKKIIAGEQSRPEPSQQDQAAPVTIGDIISLYTARAQLAPRTVRNNILALRLILRTVLGSDRDSTPVSVLDARLVREFQSRFVKRYVALAGTDAAARLARERALRSSRSFVQQARSIFARTRDWPGY